MYDLTPEEGVEVLSFVEFAAIFVVSEDVASIMIVGVKAVLVFLREGRNLRDSITKARDSCLNYAAGIGQEASSRDNCKCHFLLVDILK